MLSNLTKTIDKVKQDFDGTMNVNFKLILDNKDDFNLKYGTSFTDSTTKEEIINYFKQDIYDMLKSDSYDGNVTQIHQPLFFSVPFFSF